MVILITLLIFVSVGSLWYLGSHHKTGKHLSSQDRQGNEQLPIKKVSQYICPMHPQITSHRTGPCPICGMNLVLVEEEEGGEKLQNLESQTPKGYANFKLSLRKQQMIGVKIAQVQKKKLFKSIRAPGRVAFDPELYAAQSEYLEALKQWQRVKNSPISDVRENTRQMIHSSNIRLKVLGLSESQIQSLARKGSQSEGLLLSGKGQDNWIYADIYEIDLPFIKKGLSAQITANFLQGKTLPGKVISVDQVISPETRTAKVRIQLLKQDPSIRSESYVNITILVPLGEHISVPLEAIVDTGRESFVFIKKGEGKFGPRRVDVILETDSEAAISGSVNIGDKVVVGGNFMLDSESRLKSVIQQVVPSGNNP